MSDDEEAPPAGLMQAAAFPGLKPSPKTQLRTQLAEANRRREADYQYIRMLEEALAAHGVNDIEVRWTPVSDVHVHAPNRQRNKQTNE